MRTTLHPTTLPHLDIIGDVHGEHDQLVRLLIRLGYIQPAPDSPAAWRHPTRTAVFVGDLIDRGPDSPRVLALARRMVEAGAAHVVSGNHEFNAVAHATPDGRGGWLRARTPEKIGPHQSTLDQFAADATTWADHLTWFRTLPTSLDFGGLRVVHAAWHGPSVIQLRDTGPWTDSSLADAHDGGALRPGRELVLNGPEIDLPGDAHFFDHSGKRRTAIRTAWWRGGYTTGWADLVFPPGDRLLGLDNDHAAPPPAPFYGADEPPVIFGHYALPADAKAVQAPNIACVDFGCGKGGALGAYRWDGETTLDETKVVRVFADGR